MQEVAEQPAVVTHADDAGPPGPPRRERSRSPWVVAAVVAVLAVVAVAAWWSSRPRVDNPALAAQQMAADWSEFGLLDVAWATDPDPSGLPPGTPSRDIPAAPTEKQVNTLLGDLGPNGGGVATTSVAVDAITPPTEADPYTATADLAVTWTLPRDRVWTQQVEATLVRHPGELTWAPLWSPRLVHPDVRSGDVLEVRVSRAERGRILDGRGEVLVGPQRVTEIGLHPARVEDLDAVVSAIVDVVDQRLDVQLDAADITADVAAADPDHFVPVITLRNDQYQQVEDVVYPLVGTTFRDDELHLGPSAEFARFTLGSVGPVTAEQLDAQPDRWEQGDLAGRSGVQAAADEVLSGTNGWSIVATREGASDQALHEVASTPGDDVTVTLRPRLQRAAQAAIADTGHAAAMVVMRPETGEVLAMANSPEATFDIARNGKVAPGSVFKVITTTALVQQADVTADTPVSCPNTIEAGGRTISNAGSLALGDTVFARAFASSCNTTFIDLSRELPPPALRDAARQLGVGVDWDLGVEAFTGAVPVTDGARDQALASFGQGRNQVNPLVMATVMSSVASGTTTTPRLVVDGSGNADPTPLPGDVTTILQDLTRLVVTDGSGTAVDDMPGGPVHGKTGTADFVTADGADSKHVWFAGYQGDLAFAVVVTDTQSGSGGGTAAPLAGAFLERVRGQ